MDISPWLQDTVTVLFRLSGSLAARGMPAYGAPTSVPARVESGARLVTMPDGARYNVTHWMTTLTLIRPDDQVFLPIDDPGGQPRRPLAYKTAYTKDASYTIYEVYFA